MGDERIQKAIIMTGKTSTLNNMLRFPRISQG